MTSDESVRHAGIFAAGHGSRLQKAYPGLIKPMVPVAGTPLIGWTVKLLHSAGFNEITVLLNSSGKPAREYLKSAFPSSKFVFIIKDTATSYESFRLVSQTVAQKAEHFLLSTVDSLYRPEQLSAFYSAALASGADAALGVTDLIEDEKPLWADIDKKGFITCLGPSCEQKRFATSGLYFLSGLLADKMPDPAGYTALRQYLGEVVASDARVFSSLVAGSVDVDDTDDVRLAEDFVRTNFPI